MSKENTRKRASSPSLEFLAAKYRDTGEDRYARKLVARVVPFIKAMARVIAGHDDEDLTSVGMLAVLKAASRFEDGRSFFPYAATTARGEMLRYACSGLHLIREPRWIHSARKKVMLADGTTPHDISVETCLPLWVVEHCLKPRPRHIPLEQCDTTVEMPEPNCILDELPDNIRRAVILHYIYGYSITEMAPLLGCSRATATKLLDDALALLLNSLNRHDSEPTPDG